MTNLNREEKKFVEKTVHTRSRSTRKEYFAERRYNYSEVLRLARVTRELSESSPS